jgi:hypothetical protein
LVDPEGLVAGADPFDLVDWDGPDLVDLAANLAAGFGDTLTSGFGLTYLFGVPSLTEWIRSEWTEKVWGGVDAVDPCSVAYRLGKYSGYSWGITTAAAIGARYLGTAAVVRERAFRSGSRIVKTVSRITGRTVKVVHEAYDKAGKVVHRDTKFERFLPF